MIPILALLPLLALYAVNAPPDHRTMFSGLPGWAQTLTFLAAIGLIMLSGRFVMVPFLRFIARIHLRELFTASALLIVVGTAYGTGLVGLSPALGTFLAGVVLANSEFRHELESDIEPFKGILLGLFFIAVGASINFNMIIQNPVRVVALVFGVIFVKACLLYLTGKFSGLSFDQNLLFTLGLAQVGEFAFVLFPLIHRINLLSAEWTDMMMGVTAISMTVTPLLLLINERIIDPYFGVPEVPEEKEADEIDDSLFGYHRGIRSFRKHCGQVFAGQWNQCDDSG